MCACSSCKATDSLCGLMYDGDKWIADPGKPGGFAAWPKGETATATQSKAAYAAHVAYSQRGGIQREIPAATFQSTGASFYGVPAGMTRSDVERTLCATFALTPDQLEAVAPAPSRLPTLSELANKYREQVAA